MNVRAVGRDLDHGVGGVGDVGRVGVLDVGEQAVLVGERQQILDPRFRDRTHLDVRQQRTGIDLGNRPLHEGVTVAADEQRREVRNVISTGTNPPS